MALRSHGRKYLNLLFLKVLGQGDVRVVPLADHAQALKGLSLNIHIAQRGLSANLAQFQIGNVAAGADARLLSGFQLCGQAVGIPAGHIGRLKSGHILIAHNKVL